MSFIKNLFRKKEEIYFEDYSMVAVDMHSHLIPGIDDGSESIEESLAMIKSFFNLGYKKLITTPHIMSDSYKNTPEIIQQGLDYLKNEVKNAGIPIEISAAGEYYADFDFQMNIAKKQYLTIGDNFILIEFAFNNRPNNLEELIFNLQINKYKPILAHVERFSFLQTNIENYEKLKDRGVFLQVNINSLNGLYSPIAKKIAEKLLAAGMVDFIGSDAHNPRNVEMLAEARKNKYLAEVIKSGTLLNNKL